MYPIQNFKLIGLIVSIILIGCSSATDLPIPDKIGEKERQRVISGKQATQVVNRMLGQSFGTTLPEQLLALYSI
jgi:hypothetical protein